MEKAGEIASLLVRAKGLLLGQEWQLPVYAVIGAFGLFGLLLEVFVFGRLEWLISLSLTLMLLQAPLNVRRLRRDLRAARHDIREAYALAGVATGALPESGAALTDPQRTLPDPGRGAKPVTHDVDGADDADARAELADFDRRLAAAQRKKRPDVE